jgi:hypothetical protein
MLKCFKHGMNFKFTILKCGRRPKLDKDHDPLHFRILKLMYLTVYMMS